MALAIPFPISHEPLQDKVRPLSVFECPALRADYVSERLDGTLIEAVNDEIEWIPGAIGVEVSFKVLRGECPAVVGIFRHNRAEIGIKP